MPKALYRAVSVIAALVPILGCDQFSPSRYEITKDQSGRTLRLDKRTGEIAVVEGERIAPIRDAKAVDAEKATKISDLARAKGYPVVTLQQFGLEVLLRTSWQDDKLLYAVTFRPLKKPAPTEVFNSPGSKEEALKTANKAGKVDWGKFNRHVWTLHLEDAPFELAKQTLSFSEMVDDDGKTQSHEAKGNLPMSSETYKRIDVWNVMWRARF